MHLRKLTIAVGLVGALFASWASALGLGEITLHSALDEPLNAEIRLLQVRDLSAEEIRIRLASAEDFQRVGVERVFFLQELQFDVQLNSPNGPVVRVTSDRPVREPYLNFLVEALWPNGRLLREYTVLLDLPVFTARPAEPVQGVQTQPAPQARAPQQPQPQPQATAPRPQPVQPQPSQTQPRQEPAQPAPSQAQTPSTRAVGDEFGPVSADDTLWEIALEVRPSRAVSVQQTMLAIQRLNPDAFINDNINLLKRGQILRIPDQSEIESLNQREAVNQVAFQNNQWSGRDNLAAAELEASRVRPREPEPAQERRGQVTLAAPGESDSAGGRSGSADASRDTEVLENDLAIALEELDSTRRENDDLNSRVSELEEQIETMERLLQVSSAELQSLQQAAEQTAAADGQAEQAQTPEAVSPAEVEQTPAADVAASPQPRPAPVTRPARPEPSIVDMLMDYIWYIAAVLAVVVLGLVFLLIHRRHQREMEEYDEFDEDEFFDEDQQHTAADEYDEQTPALDDDLDFNDYDEDTQQAEIAEAPADAETGDAVGEADIYIAYGKFDQAEAMLQRAINKEPANIEARLKLLEVYSETKEVDKFDAEYGKLMALGDESANRRAAELRSLIPGVAAFAGVVAGSTAASAPVNDDFSDDLGSDLDLGDDTFAETESLDAASDDFSSSAEAPAEGDDFGDLAFDLDQDDLGTSTSAANKAEADEDASLEDDFADLNFDFDSDTELATAALKGESESSPRDDGSIDFNFSLDDTADTATDEPITLDAALEGESFSLDTDSESNFDTEGLEFDLDFDESASEPTATTQASDELDLELDLEDSEEDGLSLDIGEDELDAALDEALADSENAEEDDILADLEFSAASLSEPQAPSQEAKAAGSHRDVPVLDDDFDVDLGDLDLEALDQEMDELVGDLDDLDEGDLAPVPAEVIAPVNQSPAALDADELDLAGDIEDIWADDDNEALQAAAQTEPEFAFELSEDEEGGLGEDMEGELDFLSDTDEVATKLDLARAYIDMGDKEGARDILDEVRQEGTDPQKQEAADLLAKLG